MKLNSRDESSREARQISVRFGHDFSKRTQIYAMATTLDNKDPRAQPRMSHFVTARPKLYFRD